MKVDKSKRCFIGGMMEYIPATMCFGFSQYLRLSEQVQSCKDHRSWKGFTKRILSGSTLHIKQVRSIISYFQKSCFTVKKGHLIK